MPVLLQCINNPNINGYSIATSRRGDGQCSTVVTRNIDGRRVAIHHTLDWAEAAQAHADAIRDVREGKIDNPRSP